jgi:hypothetical protein
VASLAYFVLAVRAIGGPMPLAPDPAHYAVVARNLVRGHGYMIDFVPYHAGYLESVRNIPEMHGLLRPVVLGPLFAAFGTDGTVVPVPGLAYLALTGLVAFMLARDLFGSAAGLLALALTLRSPGLSLQAWFGGDSVGFAFFFLLTFWLLQRGIARNRDSYFLAAGIAAGLALLEKASGLFLPAVFLAALLPAGGIERRVVMRRLLLLHIPFAVSLSVYLVRNWVAYGSLTFRFSALEWLWKLRGFEGAFAFFDEPPELLATLRSIGWPTVLEIAVAQVRKLVHAVITPHPLRPSPTSPMLLLPVALLGLPLHWRRHPRFVVTTLATVAGSVAFICFLYHAEIRYFYFLGPLAYVLVAGLVHEAIVALIPDRGVRATQTAVAVVSGALVFVAVYHAPRTQPWVPRSKNPCRSMLQEAVSPEEPILTLRPSQLSWELDRLTVNVPSGGVAALARVARHYRARWVMIERQWTRPRTSAFLASLDGDVGGGLFATTIFTGARCRVVRLDW